MDTVVIFHFYHRMDRFLDDSFYFYRLDRLKILIDNFWTSHLVRFRLTMLLYLCERQWIIRFSLF